LAALPAARRRLVGALVEALAELRGVRAITLGGSYARGRASAGSDIDLGLFYSERNPLPVAELRELAGRLNDAPDPVVTELGEWGPWVDGGAWLRVDGQRVDWLYRSLEQVDRVLAGAQRGEYELHAGQQPPFGYFGPTLLGEVAICEPLYDPAGLLPALKARVLPYPEPLRAAVVGDALWAVEFGLGFAAKFAARGDPYGTTGCLARLAHQLVLALFALNRLYPLNDKTALLEIDEFEQAPQGFSRRVRGLLASPGADRAALETSVTSLAALFREVVALAGGLYRPRRLPPA
jgi:predicted nucleotidyltransferase